MSKELVSGEYCYVGDPKDKEKRIWLGNFNGVHLYVNRHSTEEYMAGKNFYTCTTTTCTPIEEVEYYYIWEFVCLDFIKVSDFMTDEYAKEKQYDQNGWIRNDSTKRLPLGVSDE